MKEVIPHLKSYVEKPEEPYVFVYPIFELNIKRISGKRKDKNLSVGRQLASLLN